MEYLISELEKIEAYEESGKVIICIFIKSQSISLECDYIEFDHKKGTFTTYCYR